MTDYRYIPNPNATEIFSHRLHDVQFIDGIARFELVTLHREEKETIAETAGFIILPFCSVEPAILLTYEKMPSGIILPVLGQMAKRVLVRH